MSRVVTVLLDERIDAGLVDAGDHALGLCREAPWALKWPYQTTFEPSPCFLTLMVEM